jgi:hypothetical protein
MVPFELPERLNMSDLPRTQNGKCLKTGKRCFTRRQSIVQQDWWRRTRFARMHHFKCKTCGMWHIGNNNDTKSRRRR